MEEQLGKRERVFSMTQIDNSKLTAFEWKPTPERWDNFEYVRRLRGRYFGAFRENNDVLKAYIDMPDDSIIWKAVNKNLNRRQIRFLKIRYEDDSGKPVMRVMLDKVVGSQFGRQQFPVTTGHPSDMEDAFMDKVKVETPREDGDRSKKITSNIPGFQLHKRDKSEKSNWTRRAGHPAVWAEVFELRGYDWEVKDMKYLTAWVKSTWSESFPFKWAPHFQPDGYEDPLKLRFIGHFFQRDQEHGHESG